MQAEHNTHLTHKYNTSVWGQIYLLPHLRASLACGGAGGLKSASLMLVTV